MSKKIRGDHDIYLRNDGHFFGAGNKNSPRGGALERNRLRNDTILDSINNISEINRVNISSDSIADTLKPVIKP